MGWGYLNARHIVLCHPDYTKVRRSMVERFANR
jgi:hypothetical protein